MKMAVARSHNRRKPRAVLRLPDLEHAKSAILNSLTSVDRWGFGLPDSHRKIKGRRLPVTRSEPSFHVDQ